MKMFTMDESTLPKIDDFDKDSNLDLNLIAMNVAVEAVGRSARRGRFDDDISNLLNI